LINLNPDATSGNGGANFGRPAQWQGNTAGSTASLGYQSPRASAAGAFKGRTPNLTGSAVVGPTGAGNVDRAANFGQDMADKSQQQSGRTENFHQGLNSGSPEAGEAGEAAPAAGEIAEAAALI
jgi:hypothetical protein